MRSIDLKSSVAFWEEQEKVNKLLVPRVVKIGNELNVLKDQFSQTINQVNALEKQLQSKPFIQPSSFAKTGKSTYSVDSESIIQLLDNLGTSFSELKNKLKEEMTQSYAELEEKQDSFTRSVELSIESLRKHHTSFEKHINTQVSDFEAKFDSYKSTQDRIHKGHKDHLDKNTLSITNNKRQINWVEKQVNVLKEDVKTAEDAFNQSLNSINSVIKNQEETIKSQQRSIRRTQWFLGIMVGCIISYLAHWAYRNFDFIRDIFL